MTDTGSRDDHSANRGSASPLWRAVSASLRRLCVHATKSSLSGTAIWTLLSSIAAGIVAAAAIVYGVWWLAALMIVGGVIAAVVGVRDLRRAVRSTHGH